MYHMPAWTLSAMSLRVPRRSTAQMLSVLAAAGLWDHAADFLRESLSKVLLGGAFQSAGKVFFVYGLCRSLLF